MRPNHNFYAVCPTTRNDFIDFVSKQSEAILIDHALLQELSKEINEQISAKKQGSFFKKVSVPMAIISWTNPLGWLLTGITYLCGAFSSASDDLKKYITYTGSDTSNHQIMVLHHKHKVDLKYDKVIYPSFVKSVDYKKANKRIK